ncbi:MAG: hypothetical protein LBK61_14435 [Spirochaetaceae bacterium]|jgi:hypothetical protein|nr:hypothetical protein [Spirochaetaceae bacterium]
MSHSLNAVDFIMQDFVYKQDSYGSYIFSPSGALQLADRNAVVDTILEILRKIYTGIVKQNNVDPGKIMCNDYVLDQALIRYSRDVFGEWRLSSKITNLGKMDKLTEEQQRNLSEFAAYGLKIDSCEPYIHRQAANLLYWFSVLKPFAIYPNNVKVAIEQLGVAFTFHNEYISYLLLLSMLKVCNLTLNIHESRAMFSDFLYDLHFRKLSRSSLEFFLNNNLVRAA